VIVSSPIDKTHIGDRQIPHPRYVSHTFSNAALMPGFLNRRSFMVGIEAIFTPQYSPLHLVGNNILLLSLFSGQGRWESHGAKPGE
jgi:hypothetical protein